MASTIRGTNNFDSVWGNGQTWQDVTASRVSGTTYTNSTAAPIMVLWKATGGNNPTVVVGGVTICTGVAYMVNVTFIVPAGQTYSVTATGFTWCELR